MEYLPGVPHLIPWWPLWKTCARWRKRAGEAESRMSLFLPLYSPFLNPHREMILQSSWRPITWSDVLLRCNECWVSGHICRRLPGMDQACKKILSQAYKAAFPLKGTVWHAFGTRCFSRLCFPLQIVPPQWSSQWRLVKRTATQYKATT